MKSFRSRWAKRSTTSDIVWPDKHGRWNDVGREKNITSTARKLVRLKEQQRLLNLQEQRLRETLKLLMEPNDYLSLETNDKYYIVECAKTQTSARLRSHLAIEHVRNEHGDEAAKRLMQHAGVKADSGHTIYVRPFNGKKL